MDDVQLTCAAGHDFNIQLAIASIDADIIGGIAFCPVEEHVGFDICGARVFWTRSILAGRPKPRMSVMRRNHRSKIASSKLSGILKPVEQEPNTV